LKPGDDPIIPHQANSIIMARIFLTVGLVLVFLTLAALLGAAIYEWFVPPTDMHWPGLLAAAMLMFVAPVGGFLVCVGGLIWIITAVGGRGS
jgi:hypothetical protein